MLLYQIKGAGFLLLVFSFLQSHIRHCCGARFNSLSYNLQALAPLARNPMATYAHLVYPLPQDKTEVIVVGDKGGDQHHHHHHHHHHKHGHHHHHGHDHSHSHSHNHGHDHKHNHGHNHNHAHNHDHNHGHQHQHKHKHGHGHFHGHDHKHNHGHVHGHKHDHGHFHGHEHDHRHLHGHAHLHAQMQNHLQGRQNEEGRGNDHDHNHEQVHNQHRSNVHLGQYDNERHVSNKPKHLSHMHDSEGYSNDVPNSAEYDDQQDYKKTIYNREPKYEHEHLSPNGYSSGNDKAPYEPTFDDNTKDKGHNSDPSHTSESGGALPFHLGNFKLPLLTPERSYNINFQNQGAKDRGARLNLNNFKEAQDKEASFRSAVHHLRAHGDIVTVDNDDDDPFMSVERPLNVEEDDSQETQESVQNKFLGDFRLTPADDYEASIGKFDEVWNIPLFD